MSVLKYIRPTVTSLPTLGPPGVFSESVALSGPVSARREPDSGFATFSSPSPSKVATM